MSEYKGTEVDGGTCWKCGTKRETIAALLARIAELQAEAERLKITAPDYVRVRIAKRLAGAEYIEQKLWAHSWEEAGRVMDPEKL